MLFKRTKETKRDCTETIFMTSTKAVISKKILLKKGLSYKKTNNNPSFYFLINNEREDNARFFVFFTYADSNYAFSASNNC